MTSTPTSTPATSAPAAAVTTGQGSAQPLGAGLPVATGEAARRTALQYLRTPELLVLPTIIGALFLFIFRYVFGGAIGTGTSADYVDYLVPGFLVGVVLWTGMNAPSGVAEDAASGVHDRLRSLPIPRIAVVAGRSLADTAVVFWTVLVSTGLGVAVGFRTHGSVGEVLAAFGIMLAYAYAFSWVFIGLGLVAPQAQAAQGIATLVVVPLTFVSSAYVPIDSMPGWMQSFASNQPVTVITNAVRSLMLGDTSAAGVGHTAGYWVGLSLVWSAAILVVFAGLAVARFTRRR
jgi:ABC-2 type transport system permease protein